MSATRDDGWRGGYPSGSWRASEMPSPSTGVKRSNGAHQHPGDILSRNSARLAAAKAAKRLIAELDGAAKTEDARRTAHLVEMRYWAEATAALAAYDRMFERNP